MNKLIVKYAIALGDSWFTGFRMPAFQTVSGDVVQSDREKARLLDESEVLQALRDLAKCGYVGTVYEVHLRAIGNARFT